MTARRRGVYAAALTPQKDDLSPDLDRLIAHYRWLLANGCDGIAPLGTTGEANSFSVDERLGVIEAIAAADLPRERMIVGTGCCAVPDSVCLTRACLAAGMANVLVLPPFYYKGVSDDGLYAAFAEVIERTGDDRLRLYIYNFPQMTGLKTSHALIERLLAAYPGTVVGTKDSSGDWDNMAEMCRRFPGFEVFPGTERYLLAGLRAGGVGCISATTNVTAPMAAKVYAQWESARADALQERLTAVRTVIEGYPAIPALKRLMARQSGEPAWRNLRPPLVPLTEAQATELVATLEALDFAPAA